MQFFPTRTTFLRIGSVTVQWYAVLILTGAFIAYYFIKKDLDESRYINVNGFLDDFFITVLWSGIIGARIWYCIFYNFKYYFSNPISIIRVWDGGLAIQGGLFAGILAGFIMCKAKKLPFIKVLDACLPNVLIAQAVGRWGNFVNQEAHGGIVPESFYDGVLSFLKNGMHIGDYYYFPSFFFESLGCVAGFLLIRLVIKKTQEKRGQLAASYFMVYGLIRLFIEQGRTDSLMLGNIKMAQLVSLVFIIIGVLGYLGLFEKLEKKLKPTIIFDYDGTLMNTEKSIIEAYKYLFKKYDKVKNFTKERRNEVIGPALKEMFPKYFPGHDVDELIKEYAQVNREVQKTSNKLMKNAEMVLKELKARGYNIAIVSTRNAEGIQFGLDMFNLTEYVDYICGLNEVKNLKPNPEGIINVVTKNKWNRECIMIGDSMGDVNCGLNYGAYTVAYCSKKERKAQFEASDANVVITDLKEVLNIVNEDHYFTYNRK